MRERNFSEHVIFVLCAGSYSHEIGLVNFVRPLRTSSLLTHRLRDIIFYADPSFVEAEWKNIANFPRLFVYPVCVADLSLHCQLFTVVIIIIINQPHVLYVESLPFCWLTFLLTSEF